jgi:Flp pilus assembly pilin Flp
MQSVQIIGVLRKLVVALRAYISRFRNSISSVRIARLESGQASVEYALVLLGAALVATLLISWATSTDLIGKLFDYILGLIRGKAK